MRPRPARSRYLERLGPVEDAEMIEYRSARSAVPSMAWAVVGLMYQADISSRQLVYTDVSSRQLIYNSKPVCGETHPLISLVTTLRLPRSSAMLYFCLFIMNVFFLQVKNLLKLVVTLAPLSICMLYVYV